MRKAEKEILMRTFLNSRIGVVLSRYNCPIATCIILSQVHILLNSWFFGVVWLIIGFVIFGKQRKELKKIKELDFE